MPFIEGTLGYPLPNAGVPGVGTDEVQTATIGGTPTAGSFTLTYDGFTTAAIPWNATNSTLLASILAALIALPNVGTGNVTATAGTLTAGIGTFLITFVAGLGKLAVNVVTATNSMTGTAPTIVVAETTPGVSATYRGSLKGALVADTTNGKLYINTGTALAPTWTVVGAQT